MECCNKIAASLCSRPGALLWLISPFSFRCGLKMSFEAVDAHLHIWDINKFAYKWPNANYPSMYRTFTIDDAEREVFTSPVKHFVFVQVLNDSTAETKHMLELSKSHPAIAGVVGWVDLTDPKVEQSLVELTSVAPHKLVGTRHILDFEPVDWLVREEVRRGLAALDRLGLTYDLLMRTQHIPYAIQIAKEFPGLRLVVDHIAKPVMKVSTATPQSDQSTWFDGMRELSQCPNVYCKLSGLVTEADTSNWSHSDFHPYVRHVLTCFSARRLMFGSDWPVCTLASGIKYQSIYELAHKLLEEYNLSESDTRAIFRETAKKFYNLKI